MLEERTFTSIEQIETIFLRHLPTRVWRLETRGVRLYTDPENKKVVIPAFFKNPTTGEKVDFWSHPGNRFLTLHEVAGHAVIDEEMTGEETQRDLFLRRRLKYVGYGAFSQDEKRDYQRLVIQNEILSWGRAFLVYENLLRQRINLEPHLGIGELRELAKDKLSSYLRES